MGLNEKSTRLKFWEKLSKIIEKRYIIPDKAAVDKFSQFCRDTINLKEIKSQNNFGNMVYTILLKEINSEIENLEENGVIFMKKKFQICLK